MLKCKPSCTSAPEDCPPPNCTSAVVVGLVSSGLGDVDKCEPPKLGQPLWPRTINVSNPDDRPYKVGGFYTDVWKHLHDIETYIAFSKLYIGSI